MQINGEMLMHKLSILLTLIFAAVGCDGREKKAHSAHQEEGTPLLLRIEEEGSNLLVYIVNVGEQDQIISRLLRPSGIDHELNFVIDGKTANLNKAPTRGQPEALDFSKAGLLLNTETIYGVTYRVKDIAALYGLKAGSCHKLSAVYKNKLPLPNSYGEAIASNTIELCH